MASPLGLTIKTNLSDMKIGDCIVCRYTATTSGTTGTFSELGTCVITEIPFTGSATPSGLFYFIKVSKGTLIADRTLQTNISWDALNTSKFIEGKVITLNSTNCLIRSLSGGVAYIDSSDNLSVTDKLLGAYPSTNEWDKYIVKSTLNGKIIAGDDNVWHWSNLYSCQKETPSINLGANTLRCFRGKDSLNKFGFIASTTTTSSYGFRPVLNYIESDIASEVIY